MALKSNLPKWLIEVLKAMLIAGLATLLTILSSCTTTHRVTQSSFNTNSGDSIVIRYEQIGSFKNR